MTDLTVLAAAVLGGAINAGTPIALAATGEVVAERAGVLNLGVEGMMLVGALAGFAGSVATGSAWLGLLAAMLAAVGLAAVHAIACVSCGAQQIVAGLALTMLATGLVSVLGQGYVGTTAPARFEPVAIPLLSRVPLLGPALFNQPLPVHLALLAAIGTSLWLFGTRPGLALQVTGDAAGTADALGIRVARVRIGAVLYGGLLAGAGGAYLSLADTPTWTENIVAGRGWIAVAMVVFGGWRPLPAFAGAVLFTGATAVQLRLQAFGWSVSPFLLDVTPYLLTIGLLVLLGDRRARAAPAGLGRAYDRESPSE